MKQKKIIAAGLAAGLLAGGGAGLVLTSGGFAGASAALPSAVVVDDTGSDATRGSRLAEVLQPLVADGTLTQDQLEKVIEALVANAPGRDGRGGHDGRDGRGGRGERGRPGLEAAATALGLSPAELGAELRGGATIADVAAEQGVAVQAVIDAMVAELTAHLDEHVASGDLTRDEADAKLAKATERITDLVNNGRPDRRGSAPADPAA
jgi:hypothetical protein